MSTHDFLKELVCCHRKRKFHVFELHIRSPVVTFLLLKKFNASDNGIWFMLYPNSTLNLVEFTSECACTVCTAGCTHLLGRMPTFPDIFCPSLLPDAEQQTVHSFACAQNQGTKHPKIIKSCQCRRQKNPTYVPLPLAAKIQC